MTHSFISAVCRVTVFLILASAALFGAAEATQIQYLSGKGPKDAIPWEFFCTGGRRSGVWTTIPVPSNWEQQGFGSYNYGEERAKSDEHGLYRHRFTVPADWKGRRVRLVFEGVMTDTAVKINGKTAGHMHIGGFYRFKYDITSLLNFGGENLLEVDVAKVSSNVDTEIAERGGDYWVFGGIYRPVYLESVAAQSIEQAAIDARADGTLRVDVSLGFVRNADSVEAQVVDPEGQAVGAPFRTAIAGGGVGKVHLESRFESPRLWTAETPNLYSLRLKLLRGDTVLHTSQERFGFRTLEIRKGQGLFLNGQRILLKGIGRHAFRPETGRALNDEDSYADARLIKSMNMNAVRMTHYPPDVAFLNACDELGLYVLDELNGWQHSEDTEVGRRLVRETVTRDVNHPSILFWDNGNEGGFNRELDAEFGLYDPQNRAVLHPWEAFSGIDTKHYPSYDDLVKRLRGPNLVMPTEVLHGLYDGGSAAGLADYWKAIAGSPYGAGAFHWVFADEGIARTDQNGRIDVFATLAPDGVVGPRHEKEGSYFAIRDLYSPVQVEVPALDERFKGALTVHNQLDFTNLSQCHFTWKLLRYRGPFEQETAPVVVTEGTAIAPDVAPHSSGQIALTLPASWRQADALALTVIGANQQELWTSVWPTPALAARNAGLAKKGTPRIERTSDEIRMKAGTMVATFDPTNGMLREVRNGGKVFPIKNGPRLSYASAPARGDIQWFESQKPGSELLVRVDSPRLASHVEVGIDAPRNAWVDYKLEISPDGRQWKTISDSRRRGDDSRMTEFPPQLVAAVRLSNLRRSDNERIDVRGVRVGYAAARFPAAGPASANVTTGSGHGEAWLESTGAAGIDRFRWTLQADGGLRLDYEYSVNGKYSYHGITFDQDQQELISTRWLGDGPYRVWKNRMRGTTLGVHEIVRHDVQPGENWDYPEPDGYFSGLRWARLKTTKGSMLVSNTKPDVFLRIGTPRFSLPNTSPEFPVGDLSFMHAIPPIGSKFWAPEETGPESEWNQLAGKRSGSLLFRFGDR